MVLITGIRSVVLENFKSYSGRIVFGPLMRFSAVCGPTGSGKSNLLEAIAFAFGEQDATNLRASSLSDLICKHGDAVEASVELVFVEDQNENGRERLFKRTITANGTSDYKLDGEVVDSELYLDELLRCHINIKGGHLLVYQDTIDAMAMMNGKMRSAMFEMISRSDEMKSEYELNKEEMTVDCRAFKFAQQKLKLVTLELQNADNKSASYDFRKKYEKKLSNLQVQYYALKLYHCEREISNFEAKAEAMECEQKAVKERQKGHEMTMKKALGELNEMKREYATLQEECLALSEQFSRQEPELIQARELVEHTKNNVYDMKKALNASEKAHELYLVKISQIQAELAEVQQKQNDLNAGATPGRLQLDAEQILEYNSRKEKACMQTVIPVVESDKLSIELKVSEGSLEFLEMRDLDAEILCMEQQIALAKSRHDKNEDFITVITMLYNTLKQKITVLLRNVRTAEHKLKDLKDQIEEIDNEQDPANDIVAECERRDRLNEIIAELKRLFSGVHDRVENLYQPKDPRYSTAITEVFIGKMNYIVVNSKNTAIKCLKHLKLCKLGLQRFIALDFIDAEPVKELLGEELVSDILSFDPNFQKALEFLSNTVIVYETYSYAMEATVSTLDGQELEAVSLDGIFFGKHGKITFGALRHITRRSMHLNEARVNDLMKRKTELLAQQLPLTRAVLKEAVLQQLRMECAVLRAKLKFAIEQRMQQADKLQVTQMKLANKVTTKEEMQFRMDELQRNRDELVTKIDDHRRQIEELEDRVFADFCRRIGLANIRLYEELGIESQKNRFNLQLIYADQIQRLETQIEFESLKNTLLHVRRLKDDVLTGEQIHKDAVVNLKVQEDAAALLDWRETEGVLKIYSTEMIDIKQSLRDTKKSVIEWHQLVLYAKKQHMDALTDSASWKSKRHALLKECKLANVALLFNRGTMDDVDRCIHGEEDEHESVTSSVVHAHEAEAIKINYSVLSDEQKELDTACQFDIEAARLLNKIEALEGKLIYKTDMVYGDTIAQIIDGLRDELVELEQLLANAQEGADDTKQRFERTKNERVRRFNELLNQVSEHADVIYKELTDSRSSQTWIWPENDQEPYLDGMNYHCVPHRKGIQAMSGLANGERAMASLALLFSIRRYLKTPLFITKDVDTSLHRRYVDNVAQFVKSEVGGDLQCIAVSHRNNFYSQADATFGIGCEPPPSNVVKCISLDLLEYGRSREWLMPFQSLTEPSFPDLSSEQVTI